jgi:two-component system, cell cycle response regulator DivK
MTTILLVDDRKDAVLFLEPRLKNKGFVVETAENGIEAIAACKRHDIDVILMDMNMPEMDGCEATEKLRSQETTQHIPIILCTAEPLPGDQARARASGCDGFMEKPIDLKELLRVFGNLIKEPPVPRLADSSEVPPVSA